MAFCAGKTLGARVYFPIGSSTLDLSYRDNGARLDSLISSIRARQESSVLRRVKVHAGASPDGGTTLNQRLSNRRLVVLQKILRERLSCPDSVFEYTSLGVDWEGLASFVEASSMPYRDEVLRIIRETPVWVTRKGVVVDSRKRQLMRVGRGKAWHYMEKHFYPALRHSSVIECEFETIEPFVANNWLNGLLALRDSLSIELLPAPEVTEVPAPVFMGVKTNLLYDALLVPNIGAEFYLGKGWTVGGNWMYAWWKNDSRNLCWRIYGGELDVRKYFGRREAGKELAGHHLGLYGQAFTYDFELGGTGYMGGKPGSSLWQKCNYAAGVEYGYSLPIARRLNLDFSIGVGYWGGEYQVYAPQENQYVWSETRRRHWFGPTKAEISLV